MSLGQTGGNRTLPLQRRLQRKPEPQRKLRGAGEERPSCSARGGRTTMPRPHQGLSEGRSSPPFVPPAGSTGTSADNDRETATRSGPLPLWRLGSTGSSADPLPLSPLCCWARSMPRWRSGVPIPASGVQRPLRRPIWRWSSRLFSAVQSPTRRGDEIVRFPLGDQLMWMPEIALEITNLWISDVPSKMV